MRDITRLFFLSFCAFLLAGCAQDVANRYYASEQYAARDPQSVALLSAAPSRAHTVIADLQSRNESPQAMRKRAAKIGADAIIVSPLGGYYSHSEEWASKDSMSRSYSRLVGSAIKYK
jgi:hypothetical protein